MAGSTRNSYRKRSSDRGLVWLAGGALALGGAALLVQRIVRQAERATPRVGRFIRVDGVRLHYVERGAGEPIVLLHGAGGLYQEIAGSGLVDRLAERHRVLVIERPGTGHSSRPRGRTWTPEAQAALIANALAALGVERPVVVGHSWGALVAVALGLDHPQAVRSLVLLSGYHFPTPRADAALVAFFFATPLLGDLVRFTVGPFIGRLIWPLALRRLFGDGPVPAQFGRFPLWMALRPGALRALAEEAAMAAPAAGRLSRRYGELAVPVRILAGGADRQVTTRRHSERLHRALPGSRLGIVPDAGHMIHYVALDAVVEAIEAAAAEAG